MDLSEYRARLDEIDAQLIWLYQERLDIIRNIGSEKRLSGCPILNEEREREIYKTRSRLARPEYQDYVRAFISHVLAASRREQRRQYNVYIIGMSGSGKSSLAALASQRTGLPFCDTDDMVQKALQQSISEIFSRQGEAAFRAAEISALWECAGRGGLIVATGGGILNDKTEKLMKNSGRIVFFDRNIELLLQQDMTGRPMLKEKADIERLTEQRRPGYVAAADIIIDPDAPDALDELCDYCLE